MVVRRADNQVDGNMVFNTGSSLYSLAMITHMSIPVLSINMGNNVLNLSVRISSTTLDCSRSLNTCACVLREQIRHTTINSVRILNDCIMKILNIDKNEKRLYGFPRNNHPNSNCMQFNTSLNNPQFGVIQHDFLLSIQVKFNGGDGIVRRTFHF